MKVLVLGVGNILMRDEGIGIRAVEELERRYRFPEDVEVMDGGTSGIELLSYISGKDSLIIIDAIKSNNPPGTVVRVEGEDVPAIFRTRISPHQIGLSDLLAAAKITGETPKEIVLFGIEPKVIEVGLDFSNEVRAGFDKLIDAVVGEIKRMGYDAELLGAPEAKSIWGNY